MSDTEKAARKLLFIFSPMPHMSRLKKTQRAYLLCLINMQPVHQVFERHKREMGQKTACLIAAGSSQITRAGEEIPHSVGVV